MTTQKSLLDITMDLLVNRPAWLKTIEISRETGLHPSWLGLLQRGGIPDPGIRKIERLHAYLVNKIANHGK